jgi:hypothetical protein
MMKRFSRKTIVGITLVAGLLLFTAGSYFQPWKLFTDTRVEEGSFISHEHSTTGSLKILEYVDGSRILRIEDLETSNGPKLEVWLTDAPVINGLDGWSVFDDGKYINLGALKGNIGDQNYSIPSSVNLEEFTSISIWCERFSVSFGAAALSIP